MVRFPIDVVLERVPLTGPWAEAQWRALAVLPASRHDESDRDAWVAFCEHNGSRPRWRFTGGAIELHPNEAEGYLLNLSAPNPVVFVMWRTPVDDAAATPPVFPVVATVNYNEAASFLDAGENVDPVPMPVEISALIVSFLAAHYRPEPARKSRRNTSPADGAARERDARRR